MQTVDRDPDAELLLEMIREYLAECSYYCGLLEQLASGTDLLSRDVRTALGWQGVTPEGVRYNFHGIGCRFEDSGRALEVDFTHDGRPGAFDVERLHWFAKDAAGKWRPFEDFAQLEKAFRVLEERNIIRRDPRCSPEQRVI